MGTKQDIVEAFKSFKLAADNGDANGQLYVGVMYQSGQGIGQNFNEAFKYYTLSANQGNEDAKKALDNLINSNNSLLNFKKGCFITTAVCDSFNKPDDCYELTMFRAFRDNWLTKEIDGESLIKEYYNNAPKIVRNIDNQPNKAEIYLNIWNTYLKDCLQFIENKKYTECKALYIKMVRDLEKKFL